MEGVVPPCCQIKYPLKICHFFPYRPAGAGPNNVTTNELAAQEIPPQTATGEGAGGMTVPAMH